MTSHYLTQWWPSLLAYICVTWPQWVQGKPFFFQISDLKFVLKYKFIPKNPIDNKSTLIQVMAWQWAIIWTIDDPGQWHTYSSPGLNELTYIGSVIPRELLSLVIISSGSGLLCVQCQASPEPGIVFNYPGTELWDVGTFFISLHQWMQVCENPGWVLPLCWVIWMCRRFDPLFWHSEAWTRSFGGIFSHPPTPKRSLGVLKLPILTEFDLLGPKFNFSLHLFGPNFQRPAAHPRQFSDRVPPPGWKQRKWWII